MIKAGLLLLLMFGLLAVSAYAQDPPGSSQDKKKVLWVEVKDFISSATSEDISSAISTASADKSFTAVILALDTPGGSLDATLEIIESLQRSEVPVIGYVYPQGKSAWSAGTMILVATGYAAMAPVTTIGSAQPVSGDQQPINDTKVINALVEKVVSLAEAHGRNETQAARFITHNDNLTPGRALERNVIEAIASSPSELLEKAHNATVVVTGEEERLDTSGAQIVTHQPSPRVLFVNFLANPLIFTTFLAIGFLALIYGLVSPGFGAEIAGAVLIILSLMGQGFDVNWGAFAMLAIGIGLLGYELYSPGFGAIGIGGIAVLAIGSILMITQPVEPLLVTEEHLGNLALLSVIIVAPFGALMGIITYKVWQAKNRQKIEFVLMDKEGVLLEPVSVDKTGFVLVGGEYWQARTTGASLSKGQKVRIVKKQDSFLIVEALSDSISQ
ncbi:NfeD family protein [Candidatus Nitrososphaera gargensis]|nr:nodulation protein NfeD [Candidatus Nitrososphaera gargensis]